MVEEIIDKKKFFLNSVIFLFLIFLIWISLSLFYLHFIEPKKTVYVSWSQWEDFKKTLPNNTLSYAFFGDSHTKQSIFPLNDSFNFGSSDERYEETYFKLKKLYEKNITIKNVVFELDSHTFSSFNKKKLFRNERFYTRFLPLKNISALKKKAYYTSLLEYYLVIPSKGKDFLYFFMNKRLTPIEKGWSNVTLVSSESSLKELSDKIVAYQFRRNNSIFVDNQTLKYFLKTISLAEDKGANIVFIKYPVSKYYDLSLKKRNLSRESYYNFIFKSINDTLKKEYYVLDYYDYYFNLSPKYFADPHHLNSYISLNFSKVVFSDLKKLNLT